MSIPEPPRPEPPRPDTKPTSKSDFAAFMERVPLVRNTSSPRKVGLVLLVMLVGILVLVAAIAGSRSGNGANCIDRQRAQSDMNQAGTLLQAAASNSDPASLSEASRLITDAADASSSDPAIATPLRMASADIQQAADDDANGDFSAAGDAALSSIDSIDQATAAIERTTVPSC